MSRTHVYAIATAVPRFSATQEHVEWFMRNVIEASATPDEAQKAIPFLERVYRKSGIATRYSVICDYAKTDPREFDFYPKTWSLQPSPSTAARMAAFEAESLPLMVKTGRRALDASGFAAEDVTHLVICTCTGFFAPGPDILLIQKLGLARSVRRTLVGFMGCYAGFSGLAVADRIVRSDPDAVVLQICIELCSLHFQTDPSPGTIVGHSLFADGCSAAVYATRRTDRNAIAEIRATHSYVGEESLDQMTWKIGDTGFLMRLEAAVPSTLKSLAPTFVADLADRAGLNGRKLQWAIHPGGRKIVESLRDALTLSNDDVSVSFDVLSKYGNMSSATIFFVLEEYLRRRRTPGPVAALGFGPGLTVEGAILSCL